MFICLKNVIIMLWLWHIEQSDARVLDLYYEGVKQGLKGGITLYIDKIRGFS